jgi:hypothetical protein
LTNSGTSRDLDVLAYCDPHGRPRGLDKHSDPQRLRLPLIYPDPFLTHPKPVQPKRVLVFRRDGHRCLACGITSKLTIDHIVPKAEQGTNDEENLQTLCDTCNRAKGVQIIDYRRQHRGSVTVIGNPGTYQPLTRRPGKAAKAAAWGTSA